MITAHRSILLYSWLPFTTVGRPQAVRAAGTANGANQFAIVIPCHRVINLNGDLGGYGGGLPRKRWLLDHERRATARAA